MNETLEHQVSPHGTRMTPEEKHDYFAKQAASRAARLAVRATEVQTTGPAVEPSYVRPLSAEVAEVAEVTAQATLT